MNEPLVYTTISTTDDKHSLSANFDPVKKKYYGVYLVIDKENNLFYADNVDYIFGEFYPIIKRWKERTLTPADKREIQELEIEDFLNEDFVDELLAAFEFAIEWGWDKMEQL